MQKQVDDSKLYSISAFCKDLLEVADVLQKATTSVPGEALASPKLHPHLVDLHCGLTMTDSQLLKVNTGLCRGVLRLGKSVCKSSLSICNLLQE